MFLPKSEIWFTLKIKIMEDYNLVGIPYFFLKKHQFCFLCFLVPLFYFREILLLSYFI